MLKDDIPLLLAEFNKKRALYEHNAELFDIYEGDLLTTVLRSLAAQMNERAFEQVKHRVAPINVLNRIISKLSIYGKPPARLTSGGDTLDEEKFAMYLKSVQPNTSVGLGNEFFNLFKNTLLDPYVDQGKPKVRVIPSHQFLVYSADRMNPMHVTHTVKLMGKKEYTRTVSKSSGAKNSETYESNLFYAYTDDEFLIFNENMEIDSEEMAAVGSDGSNPYGIIPSVYVSKSRHCLIPKPDTDTLCMTKLIPVLLSDINLAVMFQAFSVIYTIDVDQENLKMSPNALWDLKSDTTSNKTPQVGSLKPEVDSDKVLSLIKAQLQMWLTSRGIKPGAMGDLTADNLASGVAKAIDEADTSDERSKQVPFFQDAENALWDLMLHKLHPVWAEAGMIEDVSEFSPDFKVEVKFPEQRPIVDTTKQIGDEVTKLKSGLTTRKRALSALNPDYSDEQLEELIHEIDEEQTVVINEEDTNETDMTEADDGEDNSTTEQDDTEANDAE